MSEQERILAWRIEQALELGYRLETAVRIAESDTDLYELRRLIDQGASLGEARRILAPLREGGDPRPG